jgi:hypothetical protein
MSRATDLAGLLTQWTCTCLPAFKDRNLYDPECIHCMVNPEATEAATLLRQQEAVIRQCVEALEGAWGCLDAGTLHTLRNVEAALAAAKEVLC